MSEVSRRSFLKLLTAAVAAPAIPFDSEAVETIVAETDYGFTFGTVTVTKPEYATFSDIIKETLRKNSHKLADSVSRNNSFYLRLKDKEYIKINKITPEEQMKRIGKKFEERYLEKHKNKYPTAHKYVMNGEFGRQMNDRNYYVEYEEEPGSRKKHSETMEDRWYR